MIRLLEDNENGQIPSDVRVAHGSEVPEEYFNIWVRNIKGERCNWAEVVQLMDDDLREEIARYFDGDEQEFFELYAKRHFQKYDEDFAPFVGGEW